jgi:hypothetical protein
MRRPTVTQLVDFDKCEKLGILKISRKEALNDKRQREINRGLMVHSKMESARSIDGRCFVATFAFNDSNAPEVVYLRGFRDDVLLNFGVGKLLVARYYEWAPFMIRVLSVVPSGRSLARLSVIAIVKIIRRARGRLK